jgi:ParB family chromosome partitioning protein
MELKLVNPRTLKFNPDNPRRTKATPEQDAQLAANIRAVGIIQPPLVKPAGKKLEIVAGERRVKCGIAAGLSEIHVLVRAEDDGADAVRALAENVQRAQLGPVDQWRSIESLCGAGWSEEAIATSFSYPVRTIQKLRLLAKIHPAMLDHMAVNLPREEELRTIAAAPREEQEAVWTQNKPKRGQTVRWFEIARPLQKRRILASVARFDEDTARAYGITYSEDLFAPAGEDSRATTQAEAFFAAQHEWLLANLPENGVVLEREAYGGPKLPPRAERCYGEPREGDMAGFTIDPRTAEIDSVAFRLPEPAHKGRDGGGRAAGLAGTGTGTPRPDMSRKGVEMIGDLRTDALHRALQEAEFDDSTLLGLLILALGGANVAIHSGAGKASLASRPGTIARRVMEDGVLSRDLATLREAGCELLVHALSCREGLSKSGLGARVAGDAIGADRYLANMATPDLLKTLSKAALERSASAERVAPRNTGKETRAALIAHVGQGTYVLPAARFALTKQEEAELRQRIADEARHERRRVEGASVPADEDDPAPGEGREEPMPEADADEPALDEDGAGTWAVEAAGEDSGPGDGLGTGGAAETPMPPLGSGPDAAARPAA